VASPTSEILNSVVDFEKIFKYWIRYELDPQTGGLFEIARIKGTYQSYIA
jgi:hypothetical protein